jgi:uncharacterized protein with GYD domain
MIYGSLFLQVVGIMSFFTAFERALCLPISPIVNVHRAASNNSSIGNFGSCSVPQIQFATGFDNRKETSFEPVDQISYNHGSAQNIDIITQFMCDTLVNTCGADQTAKDTCATAKIAADSKKAKTGAQADAFNAVFGIKTKFAAVAEVDDQGKIVGGTTSSTASAASSSSTSEISIFGSCSIPQIEFGTGFDGRKETSFQPVDKTSYNHGSAQNIGVITQFMCDALVNTCGADQTAKNTCATAKTAADSKTAKTGAQADAFNAVFGIKTNFAAVAEVDDVGNIVGGTTSATTTASAAASSSSSGIGNFGSCSVPKVEFAAGFDGRKETSFQPADKTSYNHGSAQNIGIITQFICDTLVNTCKADQTAKNTCSTAKAAADSKTAKTGAQADAFNAVFGIKTDFAAVAEVDDQGNIVGSATSSATPSPSSSSVSATASSATSSCGSSSTSNFGNFGSCSIPQIEFATGFDGRKETSYQPVDKKSYNHGSAQNIDVITQFMCDALVNTCGADQTAKNTCAAAKIATDSKTAKTGAQADAFNAIFGITTNFAAVAEVDNAGSIINGTSNNLVLLLRGVDYL